MIRNKKLARAISDVGWGMILQQLQYKTDWSEGSMLVEMGRFYPSSKTCSGVGVEAKLPTCVKTKQSLSERTYTCVNPACGLIIDCDLNASLNMAQQAHMVAVNAGKFCQGAQIDGETENGYRGYVSLLQSDSIPVETLVSVMLKQSFNRPIDMSRPAEGHPS